MKILFDKLSYRSSKMVTQCYSTSFSLGILMLDSSIRQAIYGIYGFVRLADEVVDSFTSYPQDILLAKFKNDTDDALSMGISINPILNTFQHVVKQYQIPHELIDSFLESMEMDLKKVSYNHALYRKYIYGSAEVVGLMCLKVFCLNNLELFEQLKPYARSLGAAFQKVNFLRDINNDYELLGRVYFPNVDLKNFSEANKQDIEANIQKDFDYALEGIKKLPKECRKGVYLSYIYYKKLFNNIRRTPANKIMKERIRVSNYKKLVLMLQTFFAPNYKLTN